MNYVAGPALAVLAVIDIKRRKIPVRPVLVMGVVLLAVRLWSGVTAGELVCGLIPGLFLLLVAWITREKIGTGDGLLLLCLGLGYGIEKMLTMTAAALAVAAAVSMVLIALRRANRKTELPFLPFLFVGWTISVFL